MPALIVEVMILDTVVRFVVDNVLMVAVDTFSLIKSPATRARVELIRILLTTTLFSFKSLVHSCLALEPTVNT